MPQPVPVTERRHALLSLDPLEAYAALAARFGNDQVYLLESAAGPQRDGCLAFLGTGELLTLSVTRGAVALGGVPAVVERVLEAIRPLLRRDEDGAGWRLAARSDLWQMLRAAQSVFDTPCSDAEFGFGFLTFLGYDVAGYVERLPRLIEDRPDTPDLHVALYGATVVIDPRSGAELITHHSGLWPAADKPVLAALRSAPPPDDPATAPDGREAGTCTDDTDAGTFGSRVERCLDHIAIGDIYQVQIGHELTIPSPLGPLAAYRRLRERNPSPYMYLAPLAGGHVVGASPELFVRVERDEVTMRPIAGTAPRGRDDPAVAARLRSDPKEIAEHVMLVDLCRNDIGRICRQDTLRVDDELSVETYSHVMHLVSTVTARMADGVDAYDVIAALFPAGTMTGAPKIRAMEIIESIESSRRGIYAGAVGLVSVGGYVNLALCIRTLVHHDGVFRTRASAGVVADSHPDREWTETLAKCSAAYWAVTGQELT
jgi:anthranilate/para-aminobenzoate synthase component I